MLYCLNTGKTCLTLSGHSTETALLSVVNDLFLSLNKGNISILDLFDFSSAFDTIDHSTLIIIIIMVIFKCYFSGELIALS